MDENGFVFDDIEVSGVPRLFAVDSRGSGSLSESRLLATLVWELVLHGGDELWEEVLETDTFAGSTDLFTGVTGDFGFSWELTCTKGGRSFDGTVLNPGFSLDDVSRVCWASVLLLDEPDLLFSGVCDFSCAFSDSFFPNGGIIGLLVGEGSFPILLHVCANRAKGLFFASS